MPTVTGRLGQVLMNSIGSNYEVADYFSLYMDWQKFRAGLQNATAGPPEPNCRTIGQKAAQGCQPSPVAWVKFGPWEVAQGCQPPPPAWVKF